MLHLLLYNLCPALQQLASDLARVTVHTNCSDTDTRDTDTRVYSVSSWTFPHFPGFAVSLVHKKQLPMCRLVSDKT